MGNNLRKPRLEKAWTQEHAAERMGISRGQLIKLERGERGPTERIINRAARTYDVPPGRIIADEAEPTRHVVPVVGVIGPGAELAIRADAQRPLDEVPAPEGSTGKTVAVEIGGESLGSLFDRWLVYYDDVHEAVTPDLYNQPLQSALHCQPARRPGRAREAHAEQERTGLLSPPWPVR